eukprot:m.39041 g.39041  ORF g.39041 m.39041 type:complete len:575 (+) comp9505_c0_seq1:221-1945(+)
MKGTMIQLSCDSTYTVAFLLCCAHAVLVHSAGCPPIAWSGKILYDGTFRAHVNASTIVFAVKNPTSTPWSEDTRLQTIEFQYRSRFSDVTTDWIVENNVQLDKMKTNASTNILKSYWNIPTSTPDGVYEIRVVNQCDSTPNKDFTASSTEIITGTIDRNAPKLVNLLVSSSDGTMAAGSIITATFNEDIVCKGVKPTLGGDVIRPKMALKVGDLTMDGVKIKHACKGNKITLSLSTLGAQEFNSFDLNHAPIFVTIQEVYDVAGNGVEPLENISVSAQNNDVNNVLTAIKKVDSKVQSFMDTAEISAEEKIEGDITTKKLAEMLANVKNDVTKMMVVMNRIDLQLKLQSDPDAANKAAENAAKEKAEAENIVNNTNGNASAKRIASQDAEKEVTSAQQKYNELLLREATIEELIAANNTLQSAIAKATIAKEEQQEADEALKQAKDSLALKISALTAAEITLNETSTRSDSEDDDDEGGISHLAQTVLLVEILCLLIILIIIGLVRMRLGKNQKVESSTTPIVSTKAEKQPQVNNFMTVVPSRTNETIEFPEAPYHMESTFEERVARLTHVTDI